MSAILAQMAKQFHIIFIQPPVAVPGNITIRVADPLDQAQAMKLLNSILAPLGYTTLESGAARSDRMIVRIVSYGGSKTIPLFLGNDPARNRHASAVN